MNSNFKFIKMTFKSAYFKLTLVYVLIVMIICIGFSFVLYQISSSEIERGLGRQTKYFNNFYDADIFRQAKEIENYRIQQIKESEINLRINLIYFNLLILFLSAISSYFLAKKTLEPIEEAVVAQDRFTADASHELKTPIAAMKAEIEVNLRDKKLSLPDAKKLLTSNLEEIKKLETLTGTLLELSRREKDLKVDFEKVDVEDIVCEAYEKVSKLAEKKHIVFKNKLNSVIILGDRSSLIELFTILIENSIKYSPQNSKISIIIYKEKHDAVVKIKDSGCGIDEKDIPHIFDRFYRADASRCKIKTEGFGLGLSIAKEIIDLHDGRILVESSIGDGSEFIVKIPFTK